MIKLKELCYFLGYETKMINFSLYLPLEKLLADEETHISIRFICNLNTCIVDLLPK